MIAADKWWRWVGGRKQFNGYLFCVLATVMIFPLGGGFEAYVTAIGGVLLGTSIAVAVEDAATKKSDNPAVPPPPPEGTIILPHPNQEDL